MWLHYRISSVFEIIIIILVFVSWGGYNFCLCPISLCPLCLMSFKWLSNLSLSTLTLWLSLYKKTNNLLWSPKHVPYNINFKILYMYIKSCTLKNIFEIAYFFVVRSTFRNILNIFAKLFIKNIGQKASDTDFQHLSVIII